MNSSSDEYELAEKYQPISHISVQICVRRQKNLPSRYPALTSKSKTDPREIFLYICDLPSPWNPVTQMLQKTSEKIQKK
ncbi:hypothetical protein ACTXT7_013749 [Hymenolepis weldensis]